MSNPTRILLLETWKTCQNAVSWLERSCTNSPVPPYDSLKENEWDQLEALAGRFARLTDLVVHKLLRTLDRYEFEETGSLLDSANRAVKRGLIDSVDELRDLKDIRNEIVHEYAVEDLVGLYEEIHGAAPHLIKLVSGIGSYLESKHGLTASGVRDASGKQNF